MSRLFCTFLLASLTSVSAFAQIFVDTSLRRQCSGGDIECSHVVVTEQDRRVRPAIEQPQASERTMGACGSYLPSGQDYRANLTGTSCGGVRAVQRPRLPMPLDQNKKDKADQLLNSSMDDLKKRTKAQEVLKQDISWTDVFQMPMSESWTYVQIQGDFGGPAENYQTTCAMTRRQKYQVPVEVYKNECAEWETIPERRNDPVPSTPTYRERDNGGSTYTPRREEPRREEPRREPPRDKLKGTSSDEIRDRSRENYERLRQQRGNNSSLIEEMILVSRGLAQDRRCVRTKKVYVRTDYETRWRDLPSVVGPCMAQRGTWRTYPATVSANRRCADQKVNVKVNFSHDPDWTPANPKYLELLPNKFDLLPGEKESVIVGLNSSPSSSVTAGARIENGWNEYGIRVAPTSLACDLGEKNFVIHVDTKGRIKRKAPNPFALPDDQKAIIGLDDKGRPKSLKLLDQARGLRLDQSMNSRRFDAPAITDGETNEAGEKIGQTEAGGSEAFWVSTQFRMTLFKIDGMGRRFPVTLPNKFSTDRTDVFDNEMLISLGGRGGMDRLYRPSGPMQFIFGGLYHYLGVELSPNTDYELEVKAAQREFPFYESTCSSGEVACGDENSKEELFSEAIVVKFKTEDTKRSWLKWLKDKQFVIF
ncbi:MAG: hypothetical protein KF767_11835 [Bdellovibrionaceae bacterium]|nr:hypothetical protein [Pseudobdellovibrionaceae bacterium]